MTPLLPPATIGIIGGGQLGMMIIREAQRMGYRSVVWDPDPQCPAGRLADETITAPFSDMNAAERLASSAEVITYEFEHIDAGVVGHLEQRKPVLPGSFILTISQHREKEKEELARRGFPVAPYRSVTTREECAAAIASIGVPVVVKSATAGYDGKGQSILNSDDDASAFLTSWKTDNQTYVVERYLPLQCELSVVVARSRNGASTTFPVPENIHVENILDTSLLPARVSSRVREQAVELSLAVAESFRIVGLLCVELFVTQNDEVLVNELAPRPHNSGHYSLDACSLSQFEALVRAICNLPIPEPRLLSPCAMINLLGKHLVRLNLPELYKLPGVKLHLYGKKKVEPKRKMGHITVVRPTQDDVLETLATIKSLMHQSESADAPTTSTHQV